MTQKERMLAGLPYKAWMDGLPEERARAQRACWEFNRLPPDARAADQPHNLVLANRIRQYIGTHFTEQLTLEDIGEALSMSPYHLAHIFKEITGMSPIHYMIRCRVGEAQNLLISTDYSATQIAAIVGYTNVNHFNAIFAKLVGLPPIRYRRKYLENMQGSRLQ